ncbi:MAG: TlpA disulfide reductase family protein [Candidatus Omnitrophica bacterium]|nr:TlpA disulfide reductase family protein [Candidatus Omnitrophota bacterium]
MVNPVRNTAQKKADIIVSNGVKNIRLFFLFFLLLSIQNYALAVQPLRIQNNVETIAVDLKLLDSENNPVSLSDFKDKPVILFFWTTWCPYCRKELKALADKYENFKKDGLELLPINVGESASKVERFIRSYQLPFRVLLDEDTVVADSYNILGVPTYIYINKRGLIVSKGHYFSQGDYQKLISQ